VVHDLRRVRLGDQPLVRGDPMTHEPLTVHPWLSPAFRESLELRWRQEWVVLSPHELAMPQWWLNRKNITLSLHLPKSLAPHPVVLRNNTSGPIIGVPLEAALDMDIPVCYHCFLHSFERMGQHEPVVREFLRAYLEPLAMAGTTLCGIW